MRLGISIHALLAESDKAAAQVLRHPVNFYPRSPCGERPSQSAAFGHKMNFYPRSPCGERRWLRCWQLAARDISIHALLAESDYILCAVSVQVGGFLSTLSLRRATGKGQSSRAGIGISIHALLAESDVNDAINGCNPDFISIHALLAESDRKSARTSPMERDFYPRSPCGERRVHYDNYNLHCVISIHALLAESDDLWVM